MLALVIDGLLSELRCWINDELTRTHAP